MTELTNYLDRVREFRDFLHKCGVDSDVDLIRADRVLVSFLIPGYYWEVEFNTSGDIEYEVFESKGVEIADDLYGLLRGFLS